MAILTDRARWGLEPDSIGQSELEMIANYAAGDARIATGILQNATQLAVREDRDEITAEVIPKAVPKEKADIQQQSTDQLTEHQQVVYDIIGSSHRS